MTLLRTLSSRALGRAFMSASVMGVGAWTAIAIINRTGVSERPRIDSGPKVETATSNHVTSGGTRLVAAAAPIESGSPDDALGILNHGAGILLAALARRRRIRAAPWIAVSASVAAAPAALLAMCDFYQQASRKDKTLSAFAAVDGAAHIAAFAYTCYESGRVLLRRYRRS